MKKNIIVVLLIIIGVLSYFLFKQHEQLLQVTPVLKKDSVRVVVQEEKSIATRHIKFVKLHIDSIAVHKSERQLFIFSKNELVKTYNVALGLRPMGKKEIEGDFKTPEGHYYIRGKNPFSQFHKSLGISYPNDEDREHAHELGQRPGGDVMIHGLMKHMNNPGKSHIRSNWTSGCIAVTNEEIDELFQQVKVGTPVMITP